MRSKDMQLIYTGGDLFHEDLEQLSVSGVSACTAKQGIQNTADLQRLTILHVLCLIAAMHRLSCACTTFCMHVPLLCDCVKETQRHLVTPLGEALWVPGGREGQQDIVLRVEVSAIQMKAMTISEVTCKRLWISIRILTRQLETGNVVVDGPEQKPTKSITTCIEEATFNTCWAESLVLGTAVLWEQHPSHSVSMSRGPFGSAPLLVQSQKNDLFGKQ
ncbi:hypothetical protein Anapl_07741 [Anas platyrhynchos]|uniref:Uncharacterized protein n=1 Tax=Anas platyrhynchos TaxID=8839 RepID=R0K7S5_ANAPL|nr:hypothetical protein Anapl_07741 [Anas platyrhynchos]